VEPDFSGCNYRLQWIDHALRSLDEEFRVWMLEHDPYASTVEYYAEADVHAFRLSGQSVPQRFGVITGNIVHQIRAALDNLVWQLVIANEEEPRSGMGGNQFPIITTLKENVTFAQATKNALRGVHPDHRAFIEGLQPYQNPEWPEGTHPLERLAALSNTDKHQILKLLTTYEPESPPTEGVIRFFGSTLSETLDFWIAPPERRYPGAIVGCAQFSPSGPHPDVEMQSGAFWAGLALDDGTPAFPVLNTLYGIVYVIYTFFVGSITNAETVPPLSLTQETVNQAVVMVLGLRQNKIPRVDDG
jgi:hypothetical protein